MTRNHTFLTLFGGVAVPGAAALAMPQAALAEAWPNAKTPIVVASGERVLRGPDGGKVLAARRLA